MNLRLGTHLARGSGFRGPGLFAPCELSLGLLWNGVGFS